MREKIFPILNDRSKGEIEIVGIVGDANSVAFSRQLREVFTAAGWTLVGMKEVAFAGGTPIIGLQIRVHTRAGMPIRVEQLIRAVNELGIPAELADDARLPTDSVWLIVGHKPAPR